MRLCEADIAEKEKWESKGYDLPHYNRKQIIENTKNAPKWIHFGAGNIFRAFHANGMEKLLNLGEEDTGIIAVGNENVEKLYRPSDNYSVLVILKSDGTIEKKIIGSIAETCIMDSHNTTEFQRLQEIFSNPTLQMATFTITEKGYNLYDANGEYTNQVQSDLANGVAKPISYMGTITALLYARFLAGAYPIAMVSTDNCSHNGDKLREAVLTFAKKWTDKGLVDSGFSSYIQNSTKVSFPWTMIDKITPRPDKEVEKLLRLDGLENLDPIITSKKTYVAPFVNAEETEYLVIEDVFPNGRPALEKAGFLFTDRETVDKVERMKVCTCLNPLHTALAVFGCILGYSKISDEMKDEDLKALVERLGYKEGLPVVTDPGILNPEKFIDTVLQVRIPNPFMPDTPQRIATDTSQKLSIRFGETIKNYRKSGRSVKELRMIPLVYAGWLRYLCGVNDQGEPFTLSPDPMLDILCPKFEGITLGCEIKEEQIRSILEDVSIFGVNLYDEGLAGQVLSYFKELTAGKGAVRKTLHRLVNEN